MAQLELSAEDARRLASVLYSWVGVVDELKSKDLKAEAKTTCNAKQALALALKVEALQFNTRRCAACDTEFEASNPRKQTCSDGCRQALSRSKRYGDNSFIHSRIAATRHQRHSSTVPAGGHKATVTELPTRPSVMPQIQGTLPECVDQSVPIPLAPKGPRNRKVWHPLRVVLRLKADGTHDVADVKNWDNVSLRPDSRYPRQPITEAALADGLPAFMAALGDGSGATAPHCWCFHFAMHVDGTPWMGDLQVPEMVIAKAQEIVTAGGHNPTVTKAKTEPETESQLNRDTAPKESLADAMRRMEAEHAPQWEAAKADAKLIGCKPERVQRFKAEHQIDQTQQLSDDAQQLLREEIDREQRSAKGAATALDARLVKLRERATPERLAAMQRGIGRPDLCGSDKPDHQSAREYFCGGLELIGLKPQRKITTKLLKTLQEIVPAAAHIPLSTTFIAKEAILWGAILRLGTIDTEPLTDSGNSFLAWCQFFVTDASYRRTARGRTNLADLFQGRTSANDARRHLGLPEGVELTKKAISDAYKSLAKKVHPDMGGTAKQMTRLTEAKKRLMLGVS